MLALAAFSSDKSHDGLILEYQRRTVQTWRYDCDETVICSHECPEGDVSLFTVTVVTDDADSEQTLVCWWVSQTLRHVSGVVVVGHVGSGVDYVTTRMFVVPVVS